MGGLLITYANITSFYTRDLDILRFWYLRGFLEPIPCGYQETTVYSNFKKSEQTKILVEINIAHIPKNLVDLFFLV